MPVHVVKQISSLPTTTLPFLGSPPLALLHFGVVSISRALRVVEGVVPTNDDDSVDESALVWNPFRYEPDPGYGES
jgi:hypothetical protein